MKLKDPALSLLLFALSPAASLHAQSVLVSQEPALFFDSVPLGSAASQTITVQALGVSRVSLNSALVSGLAFSISGPNLPMSLPINGTAVFTVTFAPNGGNSTGNVTFTSDSCNGTVTVDLSGTSSEPSSSLWTNTGPTIVDAGDPKAVELGVKFSADTGGQVLGVRFYKSAGNTGTHTAHLWTLGGTVLASATFTSESASGWQTVMFPTPVNMPSGITYVASYHTNTGHYADDQNYFGGGYDAAPLHAPINAGVFKYGSSSSYPKSTWLASNYWVDVLFQPSVPPPQLAHDITLKWTGSASAGITGQNVYRNGAVLTSLGSATFGYVDSAVQAGQSYSYQVSAIAGSTESGPSNTATATVPQP